MYMRLHACARAHQQRQTAWPNAHTHRGTCTFCLSANLAGVIHNNTIIFYYTAIVSLLAGRLTRLSVKDVPATLIQSELSVTTKAGQSRHKVGLSGRNFQTQPPHPHTLQTNKERYRCGGAGLQYLKYTFICEMRLSARSSTILILFNGPVKIGNLYHLSSGH